MLPNNFKQVSGEEFIEFVTLHKRDLVTVDLYDLVPPKICYNLHTASGRRIAYVDNNEQQFNGKPNKFFVLKDYKKGS